VYLISSFTTNAEATCVQSFLSFVFFVHVVLLQLDLKAVHIVHTQTSRHTVHSKEMFVTSLVLFLEESSSLCYISKITLRLA
jgi:hypothetical protein